MTAVHNLSGSNVIVAGTAIFESEDPAKVISLFKEVVQGAQIRIRSEVERTRSTVS